MKAYKGLFFLPTIEYAETLFPKDHLKNVCLIACQHILPSTHMMLRSMINIGLDRSKIALIGKCYSTDIRTMQEIINDGIYVCSSSSQFNQNLSFDNQFQQSIFSFLKSQISRMAPNKDSTIIILDDGGELITAAQPLAEIYPKIYGVEQTSSGYRKLSRSGLKFPVKNVATSKEKLIFETPLVIESIVKNLENKMQLSQSNTKEILVVGNGPIGNALCNKLRVTYNHHNISVYDLDHTKSEMGHIDCSSFDVILGATGTNVITHHYYDSLKEFVTMANVASSDREFDAVHFRRLSGQKCDIHDDVFYKSFRLLNSGFPINFSGGSSASVPLEKIQLVCALLFLGVAELADTVDAPNEFLTLHEKSTTKLVNVFHSMAD